MFEHKISRLNVKFYDKTFIITLTLTTIRPEHSFGVDVGTILQQINVRQSIADVSLLILTVLALLPGGQYDLHRFFQQVLVINLRNQAKIKI